MLWHMADLDQIKVDNMKNNMCSQQIKRFLVKS